MALSCFSVGRASPPPSLQQAFCGMPPLTSQPVGAEWQILWRSMSHAQPNIAFPHMSRPWIESQKTKHPFTYYLQCSFVNIWPSSWFGHHWKFSMAVTPRNPSCKARFPWVNIGNHEAVTCEPRTHFTWEVYINKEHRCDNIRCTCTHGWRHVSWTESSEWKPGVQYRRCSLVGCVHRHLFWGFLGDVKMDMLLFKVRSSHAFLTTHSSPNPRMEQLHAALQPPNWWKDLGQLGKDR